MPGLPTFDYTIGVSDLVLLVGVLGTLLRVLRNQAKRDVKIDLLLFGANGTPGLVRDVVRLKHDMLEPGGVVSSLRGKVTRVCLAMASKGIEVEDERFEG